MAKAFKSLCMPTKLVLGKLQLPIKFLMKFTLLKDRYSAEDVCACSLQIRLLYALRWGGEGGELVNMKETVRINKLL